MSDNDDDSSGGLWDLFSTSGGSRKKRTTSTQDSIFSHILNFVDIDQYGCWCKLAEAGAGWGDQVDSIDGACKTFQHCRRCVKEDSNMTCDPITTQYKIAPYFSGDNVYSQC